MQKLSGFTLTTYIYSSLVLLCTITKLIAIFSLHSRLITIFGTIQLFVILETVEICMYRCPVFTVFCLSTIPAKRLFLSTLVVCQTPSFVRHKKPAPSWMEALWELSVLPKNTTRCPRPGLESGWLRRARYSPWGQLSFPYLDAQKTKITVRQMECSPSFKRHFIFYVLFRPLVNDTN